VAGGPSLELRLEDSATLSSATYHVPERAAAPSQLAGRSRLDQVRLAALVRARATADRLRAVLADTGSTGRAVITCVSSEDALLTAIRSQPVSGVIIDAFGGPHDDTAELIRRVRTVCGTVPILAYCTPDAAGVRAATACVKAGADDVLLRGSEDLRSVCRDVIRQRTRAELADHVFATVLSDTPSEGRVLVRYCLDHAHRALTATEIAADMGVHRKTLVNRAQSAGLPPPAALISWCRLLHAAYMLRDPRATVERVALDLDFGSGTALRNMFRRYLGLRPKEVRDRGGHECVAQALRRWLDSTKHGDSTQPPRRRALPPRGAYGPKQVGRPISSTLAIWQG
jgi:AraC-like DNA-binding protein